MMSYAYLVQLLAAMALGIPAHKVLTRVKRIGIWYNCRVIFKLALQNVVYLVMYEKHICVMFYCYYST